MISVKEFCEKHGACEEGQEWALANCQTMTDVIKTAKHSWMIWTVTRPGVLDDKTLRLFACFCARSVWHLLTDERSKRAVEVAEAFATSRASEEELNAAAYAANAAAYAADAAYAAYAANAARAAYAVADAARAAAYAVADAARAAYDAAYAVREAQRAWLLENAVFNFD